MAADDKKPQTTTPVDEEPTKLRDADFQDADLEDRMAVFWERNRAWILTAVAGGLALVIAYNLVVLMGERRELAIQNDYEEATEIDQYLAFAEKHEGHQLAGVALISAAHELLEAGEYADAASAYTKAAEALEDSPLRGRARIGEAIAMIRGGEPEVGQGRLQSVASNPGFLDSVRAEAAYHLAHLFWEAGDFTSMAREIERVEALRDAGIWGRQIAFLRSSVPQLQDILSAPVEPEFPGFSNP